MPTGHLKRFVELLQSKAIGDRLSRQAILDATGWKPATFDTHIQKNKLTEWLEKASKHEFIVRVDGKNVSASNVAAALRQVTPVVMPLA